MSDASLHPQREARRVGSEEPTSEPEVLTGEVRRTAEAIVARYPNARSAALPLLFLVQSVESHVTEKGMREVADILHLTPAEVLATGSFYTMLKKRPQGEYLISVCRNISCTHMGAREMVKEIGDHLGIEVGGTTSDGKFSLETAECLATCDGAPSIQINYEDFYKMTAAEVVSAIEKLRRGEQIFSVRGEPLKTAREISKEIAVSGLRVPGTAGDSVERTIGGEAPRADTAPGTRPKEPGDQGEGDAFVG